MGCVSSVQDSSAMSNKSCNCPSPCEVVAFDSSISYASLSEYAIRQNEDLDEDFFGKTLSKTTVIRNILSDKYDYVSRMVDISERMLSYSSYVLAELENKCELFENWTERLGNVCADSWFNEIENKWDVETLSYYEITPENIDGYLSAITFDFNSYVILSFNNLAIRGNSTDIDYKVINSTITARSLLLTYIQDSFSGFLNHCINLQICSTFHRDTLDLMQSLEKGLTSLKHIADGIHYGGNLFDIDLIETTLDDFKTNSDLLSTASHELQIIIKNNYEETESQFVYVDNICNSIAYSLYEINTNTRSLNTLIWDLNFYWIPSLQIYYTWIRIMKSNRNSNNFTETYIQEQVRTMSIYISHVVDCLDKIGLYLPGPRHLWGKVDMDLQRLLHAPRNLPAAVESNYTEFRTAFPDLVPYDKLYEDYVVKENKDIREFIDDIQEQISEAEELSKVDSHFYRSNFIHVSVAMEEMSYTHIKQQEAYDGLALVSDIGGLMGLFIGGSVVSLFELVDFVAGLGYTLFGKKK